MSKLPLSTSDIKQEVAIRKGDGEFYNLPALTVMECFDATVKKYGDKPALHQKIPCMVSLADCFGFDGIYVFVRLSCDEIAKGSEPAHSN